MPTSADRKSEAFLGRLHVIVGPSRYAAELKEFLAQADNYLNPSMSEGSTKVMIMHKRETQKFDRLYAQFLKTLKLQGYSQSTIEAYTHAIRRCARRWQRWLVRANPRSRGRSRIRSGRSLRG